MRTLLIRASESALLQREISQRRVTRSIAMRFVAGETLDEGIDVSRELVGAGRTVTLDYLGESVTDEREARTAAKAYVEVAGRLGQEGLPSGVSVKPSQMGMLFSPQLCLELLGDIAAAGERTCEHLTLDMEDSDVTEATVQMVERLQAQGHRYVGCAVQAYLHRTAADVRRLSAAGASLRLCKGAYAEPAGVAYQSRTQVDANFARCADYLLREGTYPRFATHDHRLIRYIRRVADHLGRGRDEYEFQMLYGVRPALQAELVAAGYQVRVYVPFGSQWYPYFMRRLAERPANVAFFLRALVGR
ncbi:MAG TPA: proline dehydrogenase family protein [Egibacteraceae bacterium]|nr:proline dehydrogenase family protein [Egibacteraceae bacterium]